MDKLKEIMEFLNVSIDDIRQLPPEIIVKMEKAIDKDDFMEIHQLGYALNTTNQ
jgi:hypothetical protein